MRSRTIKPEFWNDEKLARLSRDSRLTFVGLWNSADDYGNTKGNHAWLRSQLYPYEDIPLDLFNNWIKELIDSERIIPYEVHGEHFYHIVNFGKHQKVDHPSKARNPEPPEGFMVKPREILASDSRDSRVETETETETETIKDLSANDSKADPPTSASDDADDPPQNQDFLLTKKGRKLNGTRYQGFTLFWEAFDYKKGRAEAGDAWLDIKDYSMALVERIVEAARKESAARPVMLANGHTPKMAQGWLSARRWEDEAGPMGSAEPKQINKLSQGAFACHAKCHGTCAATWDIHHDKPQGQCYWCKKFDHKRAEAR